MCRKFGQIKKKYYFCRRFRLKFEGTYTLYILYIIDFGTIIAAERRT